MKSALHRGKIIWFDAKKGCGMVRNEQDQDLFIRTQERAQSFGAFPTPGQRISYREDFCDRLGRHLVDDWRIIE